MLRISERRFYFGSFMLPALGPGIIALIKYMHDLLGMKLHFGEFLSQFLWFISASFFMLPLYGLFVVIFLLMASGQSIHIIKLGLLISPIAFLSFILTSQAIVWMALGAFWQIIIPCGLLLYFIGIKAKTFRISYRCYIGFLTLAVINSLMPMSDTFPQFLAMLVGYVYVLPVFTLGFILKKTGHLYAS